MIIVIHTIAGFGGRDASDSRDHLEMAWDGRSGRDSDVVERCRSTKSPPEDLHGAIAVKFVVSEHLSSDPDGAA